MKYISIQDFTKSNDAIIIAVSEENYQSLQDELTTVVDDFNDFQLDSDDMESSIDDICNKYNAEYINMDCCLWLNC